MTIEIYFATKYVAKAISKRVIPPYKRKLKRKSYNKIYPKPIPPKNDLTEFYAELDKLITNSPQN